MMPKKRGPYDPFLINPCCRGSVKGVVTNFQWIDSLGLTERGRSEELSLATCQLHLFLFILNEEQEAEALISFTRPGQVKQSICSY